MPKTKIDTAYKPRKSNLTERVSFRLAPDELEKLAKKAQSYNLSIAKYLRVYIMALPPPVERVHDLPKVNAKLLTEIASMGVNLNQLTKLVNTEIKYNGAVNIFSLQKSLNEISRKLDLILEHHSIKPDKVTANAS